MEVGNAFKVEITQLKISKPLLKFMARNVNSQTTKFLQNLKACYNEAPRTFEVELGGLYVACISQTQFERCRVLQANEVDKIALVVLIDCGYQGTLRYAQLRSVNFQNIRTLKPLSREFTLANVQLIPDVDYTDGIAKVHDMIVGKQALMIVKEKTATGLLVDLLIDGWSLVNELIPQDREVISILEETSLESQKVLIDGKKNERELRMEEQGFCPRTLVESPEGKSSSFPFLFASFNPKIGTDYEVRITAYEEGPKNFFVQFTSQDDSFQKFQTDLQSYKGQLEHLRKQSMGSKCVIVTDGQLHRATILRDPNVSTVEVTVRLMETGTRALVAASNIYAIPSLVDCKPFAMQFRLDGLKQLEEKYTDSEMSFIFHRLTNNKLLNLRVVSFENLFSSATCELFHDGENIADTCMQWKPSKLYYPPQQPLIDNSYKAEVCYVDSPKEFYVHIHTEDYSRYNKLRDALNAFDSPQLRDPHFDSACVVKHITSNVRGRIVRRISAEMFKVEFVDFGFVDDFNLKEIRIIDKEFLKLPPFAYKCCLKEVANVAVSDSFAKRFRDKISVQQVFQLKIVRRKDDVLIVELEEKESASFEEELSLLDWTEANSTFNTHFANRRRREWHDDSDDENSNGWTPSVIDVFETSESTLVGPQELTWEEHSTSRNFAEWNLKTPTNKVIELENINWDVFDSSTSTKSNDQLSSTTSSSGCSSLSFEARPQRLEVRLTAITSATDFTIQKLSDVGRYKKFCNEIQKLALAQQPLTVFSEGTWCLAYNMNQMLWKRAIIVDSHTVRCLDTGTIFAIAQKSHLKSMALNIRAKPFFGIRCSLPIHVLPHKDAMGRQCLVKEREGPVTCQLIAEIEDIHFVELFSGGKNLTDYIVAKDLAVRHFVVPSGYAYISYVYSTSDFAVQMEQSTNQLKMINQYTDRYVKVEVIEPRAGALVLAYYPDENAFYRARIIDFERGKFKVYLIDHGHEALVEQIGEIDDQVIADIPPLGYKCTLALPRSNETVEKRFEEFAAQGKTRVYVRTVKPGEEAAIVNIFNESKENVAGWLLE